MGELHDEEGGPGLRQQPLGGTTGNVAQTLPRCYYASCVPSTNVARAKCSTVRGMNDIEQDRMIAKLWRQKRALDRELACLETKRDEYREQLTAVVALLDPDAEPPPLPGPRPLGMPSADEIRTLLSDVERVQTRLAAVSGRLDRC